VCHGEFQVFRESCERLHSKLDTALARIETKVDTINTKMTTEDANRVAVAAALAVDHKWKHLLFTLGLMVATGLFAPTLAGPVQNLWKMIHP
jgi:hypothetical protein